MTALIVLLCIFSASAQLEDDYFEGYHEPVGIPAAARIKAREDAFLQNVTSRIYKGYNVDNERFPFFGGLLVVFADPKKAYSACGSTLVSSNRLVTAAHCWYDGKLQPKKYIVVLGSQFLTLGGLRIETDQVVSHPDWNPRTLKNDIGVIYLPHKINFTGSIFPIALPLGKELNLPFVLYWSSALGFGLTENDKENKARNGASLKRVDLQIMSNIDCRKDYRNTPTSGQMCTSEQGGAAPCGGDSGGPLFTYTHRKILVGVISFRKRNTTCGSKPAVYTRVTEYFNFIASHVTLPNFTFEYRYNGPLLIEKDTITV